MVLGGGLKLGVAAALLASLAGCGAVETYRSVAGLDKNDPDPATTPFTQNLATADAAPYPNLSTVPPPPTRATTAAEREKLAQTLIAERGEVEAAGGAAPGIPATGIPATGIPATGIPATGVPAAGAPAAGAFAAAAPAGVPAPAVASALPAGKTELAANTPGARRPGREAPPLESSLQMPEVRSVPDPEAPRPPPPPPALAAVPRAAPSAPLSPAMMQAATPVAAPPPPVLAPVTAATPVKPAPAPPPGLVVAPAPPPAAVPSAAPVLVAPPPPPANPALAMTGPPPAPNLGGRSSAVPRGRQSVVATVQISGQDVTLSPSERSRLAELAGLYAQQAGTVRVVAYTTPGATGPEQLAEYRAALDRAQGIARLLTDDGIPANKIQAEAAPVGAGGAPGRIEVQLAR